MHYDALDGLFVRVRTTLLHGIAIWEKALACKNNRKMVDMMCHDAQSVNCPESSEKMAVTVG